MILEINTKRSAQGKEEMGEELRKQISDKASALTSFHFALGSIFGQVIGGELLDLYGFRNTSDILSFFALGLFIFYAIVNFCLC